MGGATPRPGRNASYSGDMLAPTPGQIVILNGAPRSGKSSIVEVIQTTFDGPWMNLGVDRYQQITPQRYWPSIGLRPGDPASAPQHPVWPLVPTLLAALYDSIAPHSRHGLNVITDIGHHGKEAAASLPTALAASMASPSSRRPALPARSDHGPTQGQRLGPLRTRHTR